jgi:phage/plasmid-associated DNA primase
VLSVMSGEDVQQRTMNTMPYSMRSKTEVWMASNFMPNFRNIMAWLRRLLVFEFRTPILTHDGGIKERIDRTSVQLAHMCVWEYRRLVDAFPDTDLHDHLPPEMCASLKRAQERSDTFMQFITSDHVRVGNGIECETQALQRCYLDFCKSRAIHALRTWEDLLPIFLQLDAQDRPILQGATAEIATTLTINIVGAKVTGIAPNDNPYH